MKTRITTGICRASYLNATQPRSTDGGIPKYSVQLLIPKTDTETIKAIKGAIASALQVDREGKNQLKGITTPKNPLHDGDGEKPNGGLYGDECKGHYVMNASSRNRPGLVDINSNPLNEEQEWYSGIYVRADLNFYAYASSGNKGIACGLNHLQKRRDGEPLSGAGSPSTAFSDGFVDEESMLD